MRHVGMTTYTERTMGEELQQVISIGNTVSDRSFARKVKKASGTDIFKCIQCGTCSAVCPMGKYMDTAPRKLIHMCRLRMQRQVIASNTPWICAVCLECLVRCPNGVDIPKVMEAVRLLSQRRNVNYIEPAGIEPGILKELPQIALVACFRKHTA